MELDDPKNKVDPVNVLTEYDTLAALYRAIAPDGSPVDYEHFRRKMRKIEQGNPTTINRLLRELGLKKPAPKDPRPRGYRQNPDRFAWTTRFIAYDGEGYGDKYILLANSLGEYVTNPEGLSTKECLDFLTRPYSPPSIRIFYSMGYDVNHILRDLRDDAWKILHNGGQVYYKGYKIRLAGTKILSINNYKYQDVFSFFARSFIKTVELMLGPDAVTEGLRAGKAARGSFETWDLDDIIKYNNEELQLLVQIAEKLQQALLEINVKLRAWHGPGAIAEFWLRQHRVKPVKYSQDVEDALQSAYFGGRFEQMMIGVTAGRDGKGIYEYDIRSAYPSVMAEMPNFTSFRHVEKYENTPYSLWHVTVDLRKWGFNHERDPYIDSFLPLPMRGRTGNIAFPYIAKGWYWQPEIQLVLDFFPGADITFHEGYVATTEGRPFGWVADLYSYRRSLKQSGNLSEYAIKVGLNSLYGKTAQHVGKREFHSVAWAGYITASVRAKLARAGYTGRLKLPENNAKNIIGFATDALFSREKLTHLKIGDDLGEWEETHYKSGLFIQSGVYRLSGFDGSVKDRYRGMPMRKGMDAIIEQINTKPFDDPVIPSQRFVSNLLAILMPKAFGPYRLQFVNHLSRVHISKIVKRIYQFQHAILNTETNKLSVFYPDVLGSLIFSNAVIFVGQNSYNYNTYTKLMEETPALVNEVPESVPLKHVEYQDVGEESYDSVIDYNVGYENLAKLPVVITEVTSEGAA